MRCTLNHFSLPKLGNEQSDYEDAFAPKSNGMLEQQSLSIAVSDGASESSFASDWAKMLTRAFVREPSASAEALKAQTEFLAKRWQSFVNRRPLSWFAEEKLRLGAFATLLGVQLSSGSSGSNETGRWLAIAVGDSCLFQVRNDNLICAFPLANSAEFGNSPILLSSNLARNAQVWKNVQVHSGEWKIGDAFLLATDALACWFLSQYERNECPWNILFGFAEDSNPSESFKTWADKSREILQMKNDDITLVIFSLGA